MELVKKLLEAGVHFGHQTKRWNPKMAKYIFGKKNGIHIIDLEKTTEFLKMAQDFFVDLAAEGGTVLFVGTKKQAQGIVKGEAKRSSMFYITHRWLGGLLTNFATIKKSIKRYKDLETMKEDGTFEQLSKKEISRLSKEKDKLYNNFEGILDMENLPRALFIVDTKKEEIAVKEATKLSIPICALIDTNSDSDKIAYPIPGNDDAIKSIKLIVSLVADSIIEGRKRFLEYLGKELVKEEKVQEENVPLASDELIDSKEKIDKATKEVVIDSKDDSKKKPDTKKEN